MKWLNRIAQGFSPGKIPASESPCKGGRSERVSLRYCIDYVRKRVPNENLMSWFTENKNPRCRGATNSRPLSQGASFSSSNLATQSDGVPEYWSAALCPNCTCAAGWRCFQGGAFAGQLPRAKALGRSVRPLHGQEPPLSVSASRPRIKSDERSASGSVLVYVLVLVVIAGIIGASYLTFVDSQRATTARNLNQDALRISTEQALLSLESAIRNELLTNGEVNLARLNQSGLVAGLSLSLSSTIDGTGNNVLRVQPFADTGDTGEYTPLLDKKDLFGQAYARQTTIDVNITTKSAVPNVRLPDLTVTDQPQIAVREIPVSQFTIFSAANSFTLSPAVLSQDIGRVFSKSTISVSGSFSSEFPVVAGQSVAFTGGKDLLQVKDPSGNNTSIQLSSDTQSQDFLADARTSYDTRVVTGSVLPIDSAPLNSVYEADNSGQSAYALNLSLLQAQCSLVVVARPDIPVTTPTGQKECRVTTIPQNANLSYPVTSTKGASQSQGTASRQTVAFAAAQSKQNPSQTILAFDLALPTAKQLSSIFLVVQDPGGNPLPNAVILIRGARTLTGPVSIISPHPIIIAGDFNDDSQPASIITPANLQTVAADWGSDVFGNY
jgi:hypothetical protein